MNCSCHYKVLLLQSLATFVEESLSKVGECLGLVVKHIIVLLALAELREGIVKPLVHYNADTCSLML